LKGVMANILGRRSQFGFSVAAAAVPDEESAECQIWTLCLGLHALLI